MACFCDLKKAEFLYDHMAVPSLLMALGFYVENSKTLHNKKEIKALGRKPAAVAATSLQLCLTLCNPMDCNLPGSSIHAILQARILEWVVMLSARRSSQPWDRTQVSLIAGVLYYLSQQGSPHSYMTICKKKYLWIQVNESDYSFNTNLNKH